MSIGNLVLGVNGVTVLYLIHYEGLSQNETGTLLQNVTEVYYRMCQVFYYKIRQFLQNATFITKLHSTVEYI